MPASTPEKWCEVRTKWENTPEMTLTQAAESLDVSLPVVSLRARRECWAKVEVVDLERLSHTPQEVVEAAIHRLMRICTEARDDNVALKAATVLLDRVLGRPAVQAQPMLTTEGLSPAGAWPEWLTQRRLAYQENPQEPEPRLQAAEPSVRPVTAFSEPPCYPDTSDPISTPLKPVFQVEPQFHDSPTQLWSGDPFRRPNGLDH
jgi:hypothetical protein